jgi:hypothetical protein
MNSKDEKWFYKSAAALLVATALAKLYSAGGSARLLAVQDQLLHIGYRPLMVWVALLEAAVGVYLLQSRSPLRRSLALLWLSANFLWYHLGNDLMGFHYCPCLGRLADRLPLPHGLADVALQVLVLFWFVVSLGSFWRLWAAERWARLTRGGRSHAWGANAGTGNNSGVDAAGR